ncbi:MAG: glycosyl hydrolase [Acidiferrobacteraceae bacterium]|mgnify:CR=1 FL=1|jgi:exo-beta-1,3-glucanase (GH17 family)|nr:glycosyl hydrolase [Acidiferrobacteraceae bacterium]
MSDGFQASYPVFSKSSANPQLRSEFYAALQPDLAGVAVFQLSSEEKRALLLKILQNKIHGLSYSPYMDGQKPGMDISEAQIRQRMQIIQPYTRWIRTFSCIEGNQHSPRIARELGLNTMVGVGIGEDRDMNEIELANGIEIAAAGYADILAIGNEVLLRGDISEDELLDYIARAKQVLPNVMIGYVDAYFLFENHPRVAEACDALLINCYPFWESCPAEYSLVYMKEMYRRAQNVAHGKPVIISETGWPNIGTPYGGAVPSEDNAINYFINAYQWAQEEGIDIFYFSSFDESWKVGNEGDVGAYWGLWDQHGQMKYR